MLWFLQIKDFINFFLNSGEIIKMQRQLKKIIFLPASSDVLSNSSLNNPVSFRLWVRLKKDFFWKLLLKHTKYFWKYVRSKRYNKYIVYQWSMWNVIRYGKKLGYDVILYPEHISDFKSSKFLKQIQLLFDKKLAISILSGNSLENFLNAINEYNINPHNSILISRDHELIKQILKIYTPYNFVKPRNYPPSKPAGFKIILLEDNEIETSYQLNDIKRYNSPIYALVYQVSNYIYSSTYSSGLYDKIIYIEEKYDSCINHFIKNNLPWIKKQANKRKCEFIYLPEISDRKLNADYLKNYLNYFYPDIPLNKTDYLIDFLNNLTVYEMTDLILKLLNLPQFTTPALLRNRETILKSDAGEYSVFYIDGNQDLKKQFESYFNDLQVAFDQSDHARYKQVDIPDDGKADSKFFEENKKIASDVIKKIEYLKKNDSNSLLAEIAVRLLEGTDEKFLQQLKSGDAIKSLPDVKPKLSRLIIEWTSKYNFQIVLPEYENRIVEMPLLPKALYYFFINHPEGIMINQLSDYKEEILSIYSKISNLSDKNVITENINRLVDPFDNSINVNCSRIKNAFLKIIDNQLAQHYYINGYRGYPKKIELPQHLIKIKKSY